MNHHQKNDQNLSQDMDTILSPWSGMCEFETKTLKFAFHRP